MFMNFGVGLSATSGCKNTSAANVGLSGPRFLRAQAAVDSALHLFFSIIVFCVTVLMMRLGTSIMTMA